MVWFRVSILLLMQIIGASSLLCYLCQDLPDSEQCFNVVNCTASEVCYGKTEKLSSGEVTHTTGCRDMQVQPTQEQGRVTVCNEHCQEDFCNLRSCASTATLLRVPPRCPSCDYVHQPEDCKHITQCKQNEQCFVHKFNTLGVTRYRMGCVSQEHCVAKNHANYGQAIIGKRSTRSSDECLLCCYTDHCSAFACHSSASGLGASALRPLSSSSNSCNDTATCSTFALLDQDACRQRKVADQCPNSCATCGFFGWQPWQAWSSCDTSCGTGTKTRQRQCQSQINVGSVTHCVGDARDTTMCNSGSCQVDGAWSHWSRWSSCSKTCESGVQFRIRQCVFSPPLAPKGKLCVGGTTDRQPCTMAQDCPVNGRWSDWSSYSQCSVSCGNGSHVRSRVCSYMSGKPRGSACFGPKVETTICNEGVCPVDGVFANWGAWTSCSKSCGGGIKKRNRHCVYPPNAPRGALCPGPSQEATNCNFAACPVDGHWGSWTVWAACSITCGRLGTKNRSRRCEFPPRVPNGRYCTGKGVEHAFCVASTSIPCPVDGIWSSWAAWSTCPITCGGGQTSRTRSCEFIPGHPHGRDCSGSASMTRVCGTNVCPVDGVWGAWGSWGTCSVTCEDGTRSRSRTCTFLSTAPHGVNCTGSGTQQKTCGSSLKCPAHGSTTFNHLQSTRNDRHACRNDPAFSCQTLNNFWHICDSRETAMPRCSKYCVDGYWEKWGPWRHCTATCGGGIRTRSRVCAFPPHVQQGDYCVGASRERGDCNTQTSDGFWEQWGRWHACSVTCGGGTRRRSRQCAYPPHRIQGQYCQGSSRDSGNCNTQTCP